jgi:putative SOS response-associated peptidase YedK
MCGKFTTRASWTGIVDYIWREDAPEVAEDARLTLRVMNDLPVILFDPVNKRRRVVPMRWGFPHPKDPRRPQPIHARGETVDRVPAFAEAFGDGQRGIVLMESFNEAPDVEGPVRQHVITSDAPLAAAVIWRRFAVDGKGVFACVLVTVPANPLVAALPTGRMPAFVAPADWTAWLAGDGAAAKACLKTVDGARWTMRPQERAAARRRAPVVADPGGLF